MFLFKLWQFWRNTAAAGKRQRKERRLCADWMDGNTQAGPDEIQLCQTVYRMDSGVRPCLSTGQRSPDCGFVAAWSVPGGILFSQLSLQFSGSNSLKAIGMSNFRYQYMYFVTYCQLLSDPAHRSFCPWQTVEGKSHSAWKKGNFACHRVKKIPVWLISIPNFECQFNLEWWKVMKWPFYDRIDWQMIGHFV